MPGSKAARMPHPFRQRSVGKTRKTPPCTRQSLPPSRKLIPGYKRLHRLDHGLTAGVDAPRLEQHPTAELQFPHDAGTAPR